MSDIANVQVGVTKINNGSIVAGCKPGGTFSKNDSDAYNKPVITDIQDKYVDRFDDPSYYDA